MINFRIIDTNTALLNVVVPFDFSSNIIGDDVNFLGNLVKINQISDTVVALSSSTTVFTLMADQKE